MDTRPIGLFDSGVGGLTVAREVKRVLPNESIVYFGDTKHLPYGDKSKETIKQYVKNISNFLIQKNCKAIVIACNTASALAKDTVVSLSKDKALVFDVIEPVVNQVAYSLYQKIGLIATKATVRADVYRRKIQNKNPHLSVVQLATPLLVPAIEEGFSKDVLMHMLIEKYLTNKRLQGIDALILGCTHYPIIEKQIRRFYKNKAVHLIDSPKIIANHLALNLEKKGLLSQNKQKTNDRFYISDCTSNFKKTARLFFGKALFLEVCNITDAAM